MVEPQITNLTTRVRFPSPAPFFLEINLINALKQHRPIVEPNLG